MSCTRKDTVAEVLQEADVVSLHCVLDKKTHHLISSNELAMMKPNATLVNVGRGPLIDEGWIRAVMSWITMPPLRPLMPI